MSRQKGEPVDPNQAVDYLIEQSGNYAQAKAERVYLEQFRKSKKALLMGQSGEKVIGAREQYAYAHPDYTALLEGLKVAIEKEEVLKWRLTAAELRVEVWRSQNANNRRQDGALR